jgi:hypothetical protein
MSPAKPTKGAAMDTLTRTEAIDGLRKLLLELVDDEHSMCAVAAERGIYCHGFAQWTFGELRKRYAMISRSRPAITPAELRELANRWQLARQAAHGEALSCDSQMHEGRLAICRGWDEFSDDDLARFHSELGGRSVRVVPDPAPAARAS